jgi:hypothetical protein
MGETNFDDVAAGRIREGSADIIESELEVIDQVVPGTTAASKALVVDSNKRLDTLVIGTLKLGSGTGTAVTATATELNKLASAGATVPSGTQAAHVAPLGAFTDPPSAAEMATLRTTVNAILTALQNFNIMAGS